MHGFSFGHNDGLCIAVKPAVFPPPHPGHAAKYPGLSTLPHDLGSRCSLRLPSWAGVQFVKLSCSMLAVDARGPTRSMSQKYGRVTSTPARSRLEQSNLRSESDLVELSSKWEEVPTGFCFSGSQMLRNLQIIRL